MIPAALRGRSLWAAGPHPDRWCRRTPAVQGSTPADVLAGACEQATTLFVPEVEDAVAGDETSRDLQDEATTDTDALSPGPRSVRSDRGKKTVDEITSQMTKEVGRDASRR